MRFLIALFSALFLCVAPAFAGVLYDINFEAPVHQRGDLPARGEGSTAIISSIPFGSPRVVNYPPILTDPFGLTNSLEFEGYTGSEQIQLDLDGVTGTVTLDFDVVTANLVGSLYGFSIFMDVPDVRSLDFHGPLRELRAFPPYSEAGLQAFEDNRKYHVRMIADTGANHWFIYVNGVQLYYGPLDATAISSIRFGLAPVYGGAVDNPAIKAWVDNIKVVHTPAPALVTGLEADVGSRTTTLRALVHPLGTTTVVFSCIDEMGTRVSAPAQVVSDKAGATLVSAAFENLKPHTSYWAEVSAVSQLGKTLLEGFFTTLNTDPIAAPDLVHSPTLQESIWISPLANDSDPDGDSLSLELPKPGEPGYDPRVTLKGSIVTFRGEVWFDGNATFGYRVKDGFGGVATGQVTIYNAPPLAGTVRLLVPQGASEVTAALALEDPDGDSVIFRLVGEPQHGTATFKGGVLTYRPGDDFAGYDRFAYTLEDRRGGLATGEILVTPDGVLQKVWHFSGGRVGYGSDAVWKSFGLPSIQDSGAAGWSARFARSTGRHEGIFTGAIQNPVLRFHTGMPAVGPTGATIVNVFIKDIEDPVFAGENFAFRGRMGNVPAEKATGIWVQDGHTLRLVANESGLAPGTNGGRFRTLQSFVMPAEDQVFFTARLTSGGRGLWVWRRGAGVSRLLQEGKDLEDSATSSPLGRIAGFRVISAVAGSTGHGRYDSTDSALDALVQLDNGRSAIITVRADGAIKVVSRAEAANNPARVVANGLTRVFTAFGPPSSPGNGKAPVAAVEFRATSAALESRRGIMDFESDTMLAEAGQVAPGLPSLRFANFQDPVAGLDANGESIAAFQGSLLGARAENDRGIWFVDASKTATLVAREGQAAPGVEGKTFGEFKSLAMISGYGPIFTASLLPGTGRGCWAMDSAGELQLILRAGHDVGRGKKVLSFNVLASVPGSPGQRRSWALTPERATIIFRVTFTDLTTGLMTVVLP